MNVIISRKKLWLFSLLALAVLLGWLWLGARGPLHNLPPTATGP